MIERKTRETTGRIEWGRGRTEVRIEGVREGSEPGVPPQGALSFAVHLLETLCRWGGLDVEIHVVSHDGLLHHALEDAFGILGLSMKKRSLEAPLRRVGSALVPMDDALVLVAVDLSGRPYWEGEIEDPLYDHLLRTLSSAGEFNLHQKTLRGRNPHHILEASFKGVGRALSEALLPQEQEVSTKGRVEVR